MRSQLQGIFTNTAVKAALLRGFVSVIPTRKDRNVNPAKRKATPIKNEKRFSEQKRKAMKIIKAILEIVSPLLLH